MRVTVDIEGMQAAMQSEMARINKVQAEAIAVSTEGLKMDLRAMTQPVLGTKVANAWRGKIYDDGRTGFVYTKAPEIIDNNMRAPLIVPVSGNKYLSIPTANVPRYGRYRRKMDPFMVENFYNQELTLRKGKGGSILAFVEVVRGKRRGGSSFRQPTKGRVAAGRKVELIHMFTFVRQVQGRRTIDPQSAFNRWADRAKEQMERELA